MAAAFLVAVGEVVVAVGDVCTSPPKIFLALVCLPLKVAMVGLAVPRPAPMQEVEVEAEEVVVAFLLSFQTLLAVRVHIPLLVERAERAEPRVVPALMARTALTEVLELF
jgi:hypothetical protein